MILRLIFGLSAIVMTLTLYLAVAMANTPSTVDEAIDEFEWQTTLCTPEDELLGELLWLDPSESLSVSAVEDEAFSWGLLSPDTSVLVNYTVPDRHWQPVLSVESHQCVMAWDVAGDDRLLDGEILQCIHRNQYLDLKGQAQ